MIDYMTTLTRLTSMTFVFLAPFFLVFWMLFEIVMLLFKKRGQAVLEAARLGVTGQCSCTSVDMGSYDNQRTFPIPTHMAYYKRHRQAHGLLPFISVDKCCVPELVLLWKNGIKTYGCCCGHGKAHPYINVPEDQFRAALNLGFRPYRYPDDPKRKDAVYWPTK